MLSLMNCTLFLTKTKNRTKQQRFKQGITRNRHFPILAIPNLGLFLQPLFSMSLVNLQSAHWFS